ncbi:FMR1 neighbor protein [Kogia breviceps]|uniref:FMR1 neighbor protein n=1 Tax=Kogia breviceps TaxID=27615 RepID=UPI0034D25A4B
MPYEGQSMQGRIQSKTRVLRRARCKLSSCRTRNQEKNLGMASSTGERQTIMADKPTPAPQASLRGVQAKTCHSLVKVWARKHSGLLLFGVWVLLLLLCYYYLSACECRPGLSEDLSPGNSLSDSSEGLFQRGFSNSSEYILWSNENANRRSLEETAAWETVLHFFFPTTCIRKENQVVTPCSQLHDFSKSECLDRKCCYSSSKTSNFHCFLLLKDKPTQMFWMFGLGVISMIVLGCLPICCCLLCQRR